jgi:hypothetical protein
MMNRDLPPELRKAAFKIEQEAEETLAFTTTSSLDEIRKKQTERRKPRPDVRYKRKKKGEISKGIIEFTEAIEKEARKAAPPRLQKRLRRGMRATKSDYINVEFKCIGDFDKCRKERGKNSVLCMLAFFICMGRRLIPLVHQVT